MTIDVYFQFKWAKTARAIVEHFGAFLSKEILGDQGLNSPRNAFMLLAGLPEMFDSFDIWLTPAKVCSFMIILCLL
jgi:hypothetical protein